MARRPYDPFKRRTPHWTTMAELQAVLAKYGRWYAEGCDDRTISARIAEMNRTMPTAAEGEGRGGHRWGDGEDVKPGWSTQYD